MPARPRPEARELTLPQSDARLIERIREDDTHAFETVFRGHYDALCRVAARLLGDRDLAEDVVQGVLTHLWEQRKALPALDSLEAYLLASVRRRAFDELRRDAVRRRATPRLLLETPAASGPSESAYDAAVLRRRFERALAALPPRSREAFVLSRGEGLSYDQIALRMRISIKTVGVHIGNSLAALRKVIPMVVAGLSAIAGY